MIEDQWRRWLKSVLFRSASPVVWLLDVDDTLTDTRAMHRHATLAVAEKLAPQMGHPMAKSVSHRFQEIFDELLLIHQRRSSYNPDQLRSARLLEERAHAYQKDILAVWGVTRLFSREVLLKIAAEDCGVDLTAQQIRSSVDAYWLHVQEHPIVFPDAASLSQWLSSHSMPTYLMTSSDARYDLEPNQQFSYDPDASRRDKRRRVENLRRHGIDFVDAFIGDPVDKPSKEFFEVALSGISNDIHRKIGSFSIVVAGDSYRSDIKTPTAMLPTAIGVLYHRGQETIETEAERVISIGDFEEFLKELGADGGS